MRLRIYTEDSGNQGAAAVQQLSVRALQCLVPALQTQELNPDGVAGAVKRACRGMAWTAKRGVHRRALLLDLRVRLEIGEWVVFHVDGDSTDAVCKHHKALNQLLSDPRIAEYPTERVLFFIPHYSIETWLYLNDAAIQRLVEKGLAKPDAVAWLKANASPEDGYDHIAKIKDECPLGDKHNRTLASQAWPRMQAAARSPSWERLLQDWGARKELITSLQGLS